MRLSHHNLLTHFLGKVPYTSWLFTIYKKIPEILVGNFGSVKAVRVVHHLPKISGLSSRASRLDSSYKMKLVRNSRNLMHQSIPEILVGNFGSVKAVRVVHHLPKISGLSSRASRLDSSYKMKLVRNSRNLMHQPIAAAPSPPPPPPGYCGPFARLVSPVGWAFANFVLPGDRAFTNPGAIPELLTRTRFPIRI